MSIGGKKRKKKIPTRWGEEGPRRKEGQGNGILSSLAAASLVPLFGAGAAISSSPSPSWYLQTLRLCFRVRVSLTNSVHAPVTCERLKTLAAADHMGAPTSMADPSDPKEETEGVLPELLTEFMVDMKCDSCVSAVKNKLQTVDGVRTVDADLINQLVRVLGSASLRTLTDALDQTGRKARLIGQGNPEVSAAVAEFKGPVVHGVVRFAQVNMELARIEASFSGLSPGIHRWSINEYGDLTEGAASTGRVFDPSNGGISGEDSGSDFVCITAQAVGDLGTLNVSMEGEAFFSGTKKMLRVVDLIGRSVVVCESEDKSSSGVAAAVIARSAGVGENYKKICTCDGTVIWESSNNYVSSS